MSFGPSISVERPVTTQTTSALNLRTSPSKVVFPSQRPVTSQRCCETGRPVMLDPVTGNMICSCQLKAGLPAYLSRVPSLPETMYSATHGQFPHSAVVNPESLAAFYQMSLKSDRGADALKLPPSGLHASYYLEQLMTSHPYNAFYPGFDLNHARRKNATRETTGALKAWLYEHRKNPYPTKGEKIMLAIITRMTLTQVSTWFANARRRLKKENKLLDDKGGLDDLDDIDVDDSSEKNNTSRLSESTDGGHTSAYLSDISDADDDITSPNVTSGMRTNTPHSVGRPHPYKPSADFKVDSKNRLPLYSPENSIVGKSNPPLNNSGNDVTQKRSPDPNNHEETTAQKSSPSTSNIRSPSPVNDHLGRRADGHMDKLKPKIWSISHIINHENDK